MNAILQLALADLDPARPVAERLESLVRAGADRLPPPGQGNTLTRWRGLAAVAATDLALAKLYEGHTDALAILAELRAPGDHDGPDRTWGVWAAESPGTRAVVEVSLDGGVRLSGRKCWCSGAASGSHALLTAWLADGTGPQLVAVALRQPGVQVHTAAWQAIGMAASASVDVEFDRVPADLIGQPGDYLRRPGFWHGGGGIAACWYGAACGVAEALRRAIEAASAPERHPFRLAALGRVEVDLHAAAAVLREAAHWIDAHPHDDASKVALRARLCVEASATRVLDTVGRALGAAPFCRDAHFARLAADLPVFMRQSHAERDLAALGERVVDRPGESPWAL